MSPADAARHLGAGDRRRREETQQYSRRRRLALRRPATRGRNRSATPGKPRNTHCGALIATAYVHTVIDDHSRVAYAEIHNDETAVTAVGVLRQAVSWFAARGVVERVLSDNGSANKSHPWRDTCTELSSKAKKPPLPAADEWQDRTIPPHPRRRLGLQQALHNRISPPAPGLAARLQSAQTPHRYRRPPTSRLTNLAGQYS
jgi:hypothetical protein